MALVELGLTVWKLYGVNTYQHFQFRLSTCSLTSTSCEILVPALTQPSSLIRELDLSGNELGDAGVRTLSDALKKPKCKVELLW